jgi:hypothetical protein
LTVDGDGDGMGWWAEVDDPGGEVRIAFEPDAGGPASAVVADGEIEFG